MDHLLKDLRFGLRAWRKDIGLSVAITLTLALGICTNTTVFTLTHVLWLKKPPVFQPDHVAAIYTRSVEQSFGFSPVPMAHLLEWRSHNRVFEDLAGATDVQSFSLSVSGQPVLVNGALVTANYFDVLGVPAQRGRTFAHEEGTPGHENVAILSDPLWKTRFGADPNIVNSEVTLDEQKYTVIGIMPPEFQILGFPAQLWIPVTDRAAPFGRVQTVYIYGFGRLKPTVSTSSAAADLRVISNGMPSAVTHAQTRQIVGVLPLHDFISQITNYGRSLTLLTAAVGFVMLIACINVAGLLIARSLVRRREIGIRIALGAGRTHILRQIVTENMLLGMSGAALGLVLTLFSNRFLQMWLAFDPVVRQAKLAVDPVVLAFALLVALASTTLISIGPVLWSPHKDLQPELQETPQTLLTSPKLKYLRKILVGAETSVALVLLTVTGLLGTGIWAEIHAPQGFDAGHVLTATVILTSTRYDNPATQRSFFYALQDHIQKLPGVELAGASSSLPLTYPPSKQVILEGNAEQGRGRDYPKTVVYFDVTPGYFSALRIPVIAGRPFVWSDDDGHPSVLLVNQTFATQFFAGESAIEHRISVDEDAEHRPIWSEIVGVVGDVADFEGEDAKQPQLYRCYLQSPSSNMTIVIRTKGEPGMLAPDVHRSVWSVDKNQALASIMTMNQVIAQAEQGDMVMGSIIGIVSGLAVLLAAIGMHGVVLYLVSHRQPELALRMAFGATPSHIFRIVASEGLTVAVAGATLGALLSLPLPKIMVSAFPGLHPKSVLVLGSAYLTVIVIGAFVSAVPALSASRLDPSRVLHYE